jgi:hypothetical protein
MTNDFTPSRRRRKNQRPFGRKRHWIHPHFEVGLFVEDTRALPVQSTMGVNDKRRS